MRVDKIRAEYVELLPKLDELRASLVTMLRHYEDRGAEVKSRIKRWEPVRDKLVHKSVCLEELTDLVGVRVIVPNAEALLEVSDAIKNDFLVTEWRIQHLRPGESESHFVVRAAHLERISAEIQVLTAEEEARRALEHELKYKIEDELSKTKAATRILGDVVRQFKTLIESPGVHEKRDVHGFIESHNFLLYPNPDALTSEVPIG